MKNIKIYINPRELTQFYNPKYPYEAQQICSILQFIYYKTHILINKLNKVKKDLRSEIFS